MIQYVAMINYDQELTKLIDNLKQNNIKPTLLLHSCCAPCSSYVLTKLFNVFNVTVLYYNPCIFPASEFELRQNEQIKLINELNKKFNSNINYITLPYDYTEFINKVVGLENQPEGGKRCNVCYKLRLNNTAKLAREKGFDYFGTTLSVSPYKHANWLNEIGKELEKEFNIKFLFADFKKQNGYLESINLSKTYNLYRQNYCGCSFSLNNLKKE